jgi:hypothetical protein|tara:strand:+ start:7242 stop:7364 length:123 start_codon:yes stop_codon:yes gene_type:complete
MGPAANTTQAFETNAGLMTMEKLRAMGEVRRNQKKEEGEL